MKSNMKYDGAGDVMQPGQALRSVRVAGGLLSGVKYLQIGSKFSLIINTKATKNGEKCFLRKMFKIFPSTFPNHPKFPNFSLKSRSFQ